MLRAYRALLGFVPFFCRGRGLFHHSRRRVAHLIHRGESCSYTPYQPEVSQGTLQYLFEFDGSRAADRDGCFQTHRFTTCAQPAARR